MDKHDEAVNFVDTKVITRGRAIGEVVSKIEDDIKKKKKEKTHISVSTILLLVLLFLVLWVVFVNPTVFDRSLPELLQELWKYLSN